MEVDFKRNSGYNITKGVLKMKIIKKIFVLTILLSTLFTFNIFAMEKGKAESARQTPLNEKSYEDRSAMYRWTWVNDGSCVRFNLPENTRKDTIIRQYNNGLLPQWAENGTIESAKVITRELYSGKWSQSEDGIRSFTFDDYTIPVGVTKIDGVLYAFNTYGELKAGYEYYTGFKTEADGLVKADSAEFTQWLGTQYLPECTSHE